MIRANSPVVTLIFAIVLASAAGCRTSVREPASPESDKKIPSVAKAEKSPGEAAASDTELAPAVAHILRTAGRSGSLVYRAACGPQRAFTEIYPLNPPVAPEPMDQALTEIGRRYPNIRWNETSAGLLRVMDSATRAGLLRVRIPEFILLDDRGPDDALAAIWKTPGVRAFVKKTGVRILLPVGRSQRKLSGVVAIHLKNVTVTEVLDAIVASYKDRVPQIWNYRECGSGGRMIAEVSVR